MDTSISKLSFSEKMSLAFATSDLNILEELKDSLDVNIRRAVAKNRYLTEKIANYLAFDPVLNVSYIASKHPMCTAKRVFRQKIISKCVLCEKNEDSLECGNCEYNRP